MEWLDAEPELVALLEVWDDGASGASSTASTTSSSSSSGRGSASGVNPSPWGLQREASAVGGGDDADDALLQRRPRAVKINASRERQKKELQTLQASAVELEKQLDQLHLRKQKRLRTRNSGALMVWENSAVRQLQARKRAEVLNAGLRQMMATQAAVAEDLVRAIRRAEHAWLDACTTAMFPVDRATLLQLDDANAEQRLFHRLEQISAQWFLPFSACSKFNNDENGPREIIFFETSVIRDDGIESVPDIRASTAFPFPRERLEDELWKYFCTLSCQEEGFSVATDNKTTDNTITGVMRLTSSMDGVQGIMDARVMKRQFRNKLGELILTSTRCGKPALRYTDERDNGELAKVEAIVLEDSWLRVLDADECTSSLCGSPPMSLAQTVRRTRIQFTGQGRPEKFHVDAVKRFLAVIAQNEMRWGQEKVKDILMQAPTSMLAA